MATILIPLYQAFAQAIALDPDKALDSLRVSRAKEYLLEELLDFLPHGSGFDAKASLEEDRSTEDKLVFLIPYHHMDENGFYVGWSETKLVVKPSLAHGYTTSLWVASLPRCINRTSHKEYVSECYHEALNRVVDFSVLYGACLAAVDLEQNS